MNPYPHQVGFLKAVRNNKNACIVVHRRAGKDLSCIQAWLLRALMRVGTHVYLFPLITQARSVIWKGMDYSGKPFLSSIPDSLIVKKNEARMEIELFNGSRLILSGSNNFDGLMGTNPITIIYSEFSLHNPLARQYLNPIIVQNDGREIIQATPRGLNHLHDVYQIVRDNPNYFVQHLSVNDTTKHDGSPIITPEQITESRRMGMSEEMIRQEFMVDFNVGNIGAYFTKELSDMDREGRISELRPNPRLPLHSVWDLGGTDATAGILFQIEGSFIHVLFLLHDTGKGLKFYLEQAEKIRQSIGCPWGNHWAPHDIGQKHQGFEHTESRIMQARKYGWMFQVVPKVNFEDGIESLRYVLPKIRINKSHCSLALRALREYQRLWNEKKACYDKKPLDNWATHIADAFRYLAVNYRRLYDIPHAPTTYSTGNI